MIFQIFKFWPTLVSDPICIFSSISFTFKNIKLIYIGNGQGWWNYDCTIMAPVPDLPDIDVDSSRATNWQDAQNSGIIYLDRYHVECPDDSFLTGWQPETRDGRTRIAYSCGKYKGNIVKTDDCAYGDSGRNDLGVMIYLDRHLVNCPPDRALVAFNGANDNWRFKFQYKCCKFSLNYPTAKPTFEPTVEPTQEPVAKPSRNPTLEPTYFPTEAINAEGDVGEGDNSK